MEHLLRNLFDYQKFSGNAALQDVIDAVHSRYAMRELQLDEMELVSAAGVAEQPVSLNKAKKPGK